jgi:hypothetical protein
LGADPGGPSAKASSADTALPHHHLSAAPGHSQLLNLRAVTPHSPCTLRAVIKLWPLVKCEPTLKNKVLNAFEFVAFCLQIDRQNSKADFSKFINGGMSIAGAYRNVSHRDPRLKYIFLFKIEQPK